MCWLCTRTPIRTSEDGHGAPDADWSERRELTHAHLDEEQRQAGEDQHDDVRDEERAATVLVGAVREAPHVAEADGVANGRQQEVEFAAPVASLFVLVAVRAVIAGGVGHLSRAGQEAQVT